MKQPISEVFNMDCIEYMKQFPDKHFDLAIVDPPYGINMGMGHKGSEKRGDKNKYKTFAGGDLSIPNKEYFNELFRVSKNQIIWGGNYMTEFLKPVSSWIIWDKKQPENFSMAMAELAWSSFGTPMKIFEKRVVGADDERIHPTQKPVALYKWLLANYAKQSERCGHKHTEEYNHLCSVCKEPLKILDTHLGSGSSRIAAYDMGFDFYATELDKDYFDAQEKRFNDFKSQLKLF
jgi:site-specific DNA-methyltransferase (adenine-specific)